MVERDVCFLLCVMRYVPLYLPSLYSYAFLVFGLLQFLISSRLFAFTFWWD